MKQKIKIGTYKHFKGKYYKVMGIVHHSETLEDFVLYRALYTSKQFGKEALWVRPLEMFFETVEVEGKKIPRFQYIGPTLFKMNKKSK